MGIVFVIFIHLVILFILSVAFSTLGGIITYYVSEKEKRKRKIILAIILPFIGFFSLYIFWLTGSIIVSETKGVDVGIGDTWYVPLENKCELVFIDLPEQAYIEKNGQTVISKVSQIAEKEKLLFGKTNDNKFFSFNTQTNELKNFANESELTLFNSNKKPKLINAFDFYYEKRNSIVGILINVVGIISLILSAAILYLLQKAILKSLKREQ